MLHAFNFTIIGFVLFITLVAYAWRQARRHKTSVSEELVGICTIAWDQTVRKNENKERIVALLWERANLLEEGEGGLSNAEIREALGVSRASVVRYMDELEREGRVEQVGQAGQGVCYRLR